MTSPQNPRPPTTAAIKAELLRLIEKLAVMPYAAKRLGAVLAAAHMALNYKSNRAKRFTPKESSTDA